MNKEQGISNLKPYKLKFNIPYLMLSLLLLISSCSNPYKNIPTTEYQVKKSIQIPYTLPYTEKMLVYKAEISFYKKNINGLLIIKKTDEFIYRIALTTQFGLKIFDFELNDGILNVRYCIESLNRKFIINTFEDNFNLLLMQNKFDEIHLIENPEQKQKIWQFRLGKVNHNYTQNIQSEKIEIINSKKRNSEKISVGLHSYAGDIPTKIMLTHHDMKLKMNLKLIQ